jgi:3-methylcrotonyl-CoA carboxylase beta subunit
MPRRAWAEHPRLRDDGIIDPADTRRVPALAIAASINAAFPQRKVREFRM